MAKRVWVAAGALLCTLGTVHPASAQAPTAIPPAARQRVGLVLSGGGARGGAHIGALRALEELRIPIDMIAGTSIGAVIGGLYAAGIPVDEIEQIIKDTNWDAAFLEETPRRLRSFRRKRDDDLFLVDQDAGFGGGKIKLPAGLVQGQVVDEILARVTLPVAAVTDFDTLMVPFRTVATDLSSGEAVPLGHGSLARAIRASLSVPAVIAPVEIDGRLLVDGGISMNLPVQVAQEMGADRIIAVDITSPLRSSDELGSVVDITSQLSNFITRSGVPAQRDLLGPEDFAIDPAFDEEVTPASFMRMVETVPVGYAAVMQQRAALSRLALSREDYQAYRDALVDPRSQTPPTIDFIRLDNRTAIADRLLEPRLRGIELGEALDVDAVERSIGRIYGLELSQNVRYEIVTEGGQSGLEIATEPRSWGPNYFQFGIQYSYSGKENAVFGVAGSYLRTELNELAGEWRSTAVIGDEPSLATYLHQPFGRYGLSFFAPGLTLDSKILNVFDGAELGAEFRLRQATLEIGVGRVLADWGEWRVGVRETAGNADLRVGDPAAFDIEDYRKGELFLRIAADTLDSLAFPRSGVLGSGELRLSRPDLLRADEDFDQLELSTAYAKTWGRHTLLSTLRFDTTLEGQVSLLNQFRLGGFLDLSGLNRDQLNGQHVLRVGTSYYRRIGNLALFPAFAGISIELGNTWDARSDIGLSDAIWGGSFWTGVDTPVGPVYMGYGVAEGGVNAFYVFLGRPF